MTALEGKSVSWPGRLFRRAGATFRRSGATKQSGNIGAGDGSPLLTAGAGATNFELNPLLRHMLVNTRRDLLVRDLISPFPSSVLPQTTDRPA
jgi:hypothetical protein